MDKERIIEIVEHQNRWRREKCINLIASESVMSPLAERLFVSDFEGRYNEHSGPDCHYEGTKISYEIEEICNDLFREAFGTRFADVRPISGAVANMIVFNAFTKPNDTIVSLGIPNGAHVSATRWGIAGVHGLKDVPMYFNPDSMNIDVEKSVELIKRVRPKMVVLGGSMFIFPEPLKEMTEQVKEADPDIKIMYDSAHVFGLVYNKRFQFPLRDGAHIITTSTHKTFQGPQGGLIIGSPQLDESDWQKVDTSIFPGTLSNTHIHRFPALAITALEMNQFGQAYASQVVKNAKALGRALHNSGFKPLCPQLDFTESHQVIVDVKQLGGGQFVARQLANCNIICNKMSLPWDSPHDATHNPSGIRLGVQELTRWGMREAEMQTIAALFERVLVGRENPETVRKDANWLKYKFNEIKFCFK